MIKFDSDRKTTFNPHDLNLEGRPTKCLLIFDDEVWEDCVLSNKDLETTAVTNTSGRKFNDYYYTKVGDENILLVYPPMGASASVCEVELLVASGINRIVAFGTCGRLNEKTAKNTIILPTEAYREEGTSYHYLPDKDEIKMDAKIIKTCEDVFERYNFTYEKGKIWTTDAVYRETIGKVKLMQKRGCIGIDMELSALLALAEYRNFKFAEFLIGDDAVCENTAGIISRQNNEILAAAIEILNNI